MEFDGLFPLNEPGGIRTAPPAGAESAAFTGWSADSPLPVRMRPTSLDELVGQQHLLAPGAPLRQLVTGSTPMSVILWGPPGTGKTTIAHLVAVATDRKFVAMSALSAGVKDVRAVIDTARRARRAGGPPTVLFIDEVHRFSKTQQDSLLAAVEDRTVTLLAATTENPYFSVISPLLSRCVLLTLHALDEDDVRQLVRRAITDQRGLGGAVTLTDEAEEHLVRLAGGDVRKALTALEAAAGSATAQGVTEIDLATAEKAVDIAAVRYDRDGDAHYDVTSAFIKSMRGSDPDAALHWLARMLVAGEDPRFIARRIVIFASEDIGMADPQALLVATAAAQAVQSVGLPEAQLNLAQAVVHLATAPKSNSVTMALGAAMADIRAGRGGAVPPHLRDSHYPGSRGLGHGKGYRYPHDDPKGVVRQQYVPDDLIGTDYYNPTDHGAERAVGERLPRLRRIVRGPSSAGGSPSPGSAAGNDPSSGGGSSSGGPVGMRPSSGGGAGGGSSPGGRVGIGPSSGGGSSSGGSVGSGPSAGGGSGSSSGGSVGSGSSSGGSVGSGPSAGGGSGSSSGGPSEIDPSSGGSGGSGTSGGGVNGPSAGRAGVNGSSAGRAGGNDPSVGGAGGNGPSSDGVRANGPSADGPEANDSGAAAGEDQP